MALAGQSQPAVAVLAAALPGRRQGAELAHDLMSTWGVPSIILDEAYGEGDPAQAGSVGAAEMAALRMALDESAG